MSSRLTFLIDKTYPLLPPLATDDLNSVLFNVRRVHKQVAEVDIFFLVLSGVSHLLDESCMAVVDVILAAEQCGELVQQSGRNN